MDGEEVDLYELLGVERGATKSQIKKAYHKAALSSHPDKVAEHEREESEATFKAVTEAYEILYDDEKRHLYDTHGMSAFTPGGGPGMNGGVDLDDILAQMFGMGGGMGGMGGMPGFGGAGPRRPRKGRSEEQDYDITLEELYRGKTVRFASTKNVICSHCKGSGGKEKAKPRQCATCNGQGFKAGLRSVGPGLVTQETTTCNACKGTGKVFKEKDRCRKCKGDRVTEARKVLELYIPRGSKDGDRIILEGEADQVPDQEPGDIVFTLRQAPHEVFERAGADLQADLKITLSEALTGFSRVVLKHLDGRGIQIHVPQPKGRILKPGQVLKVEGEGMPYKKGDMRGDLYLVVDVIFPQDGWLKDEATLKRLQDILPKPEKPIAADVVDEVDYDEKADLKDFGSRSDDPQAGSEWADEDDDDHMPDGAQCATQ